MYHDVVSLENLPPVTLRHLAEQSRKYADKLDSLAQRAEESIRYRQNMRGYQKRALAASHTFAAMLDEGMSMEWAVLRAAEQHKVRPEAVQAIWPSLSASWKKRDRIALERKIMTAYRAGHNDTEIGKLVGRHSKTIAKIRRKVLAELDRMP